MSDFERCLKVVFGAEDGYSNHPADRGGKTNMGVTHGTLANAYGKGIVSHNDIRKLTRAEAARIYEVNYWMPSKAAEMKWPLCCLHFDAAVNHGVGGAGRLLQRTINRVKGTKLKEDGVVGSLTLKELKDIDLYSLCRELLKVRREYFEAIVRNNSSQRVFLRGWMNRLKKLEAIL